ncbi:MAG: hypothetical protein WC924_04720 [Candidatus Gracilibacteria bacterium]
MNIHLAQALDRLPALKEVPSVAQVERAPNGTRWGGTLRDGDWELVKIGPDSFTSHVATN